MLKDEILSLLKRRPVMRVHEIARVLRRNPNVVKAILHYMTKKGLVRRIMKGAYTISNDPKVVATWLYIPSYISMEYALFLRNIVEQIINVIQVMISFKIKNMEIEIYGQRVKFYRIPKRLMFGFNCEYSDDGFCYLIAEPEKAILDMLYHNKDLRAFTIHWDELDLDKLIMYSKEYPKRVRKRLEFMLQHI